MHFSIRLLNRLKGSINVNESVLIIQSAPGILSRMYRLNDLTCKFHFNAKYFPNDVYNMVNQSKAIFYFIIKTY